MMAVILALGLVLVATGCSVHAVQSSPGGITDPDPCYTATRKVDGDPCLHVERVSGDCSSPDAVREEQAWLSENYPGYEDLGGSLTTSLIGGPSHVWDTLRIRDTNGEELSVCFDITPFWPSHRPAP